MREIKMSNFLRNYWAHGINKSYDKTGPWHEDGFLTIFAPIAISATLYAASFSWHHIERYSIPGAIILLASSQIRPIINYRTFITDSNAQQNGTEEKSERLEELV